MQDNMLSIADLKQLFEQHLMEQNFVKPPERLYQPVAYTMEMGGKRMRPVLLLYAAEMFGNAAKKALNAALAIEIFHNFTLLHDDIMDNASLRRGLPTVHKKWSPNTAILSGDTMLVLAYSYLEDISSEIFLPVYELFNATARQVCEGQQYDMEFETETEVDIAQYMEMIRLKTAVLPAASLNIGAIFGGANPACQRNIFMFGQFVGLAFQIMDDLLDVYGSVDKFGKRTGNDIIFNKKTFLLTTAQAIADKENKELLYYWLQQNDKDSEKIKEVKNIYNRLNIKEITEQRIEDLYKQAMAYLEQVNVSPDRKSGLVDFAKSLKVRNH